MQEIAASRFKEQCLALLRGLDEEGLVITRHGRPVALLVPWERRCARLIGSLADHIEVKGDLLSTGQHWQAPS